MLKRFPSGANYESVPGSRRCPNFDILACSWASGRALGLFLGISIATMKRSVEARLETGCTVVHIAPRMDCMHRRIMCVLNLVDKVYVTLCINTTVSQFQLSMSYGVRTGQIPIDSEVSKFLPEIAIITNRLFLLLFLPWVLKFIPRPFPILRYEKFSSGLWSSK